MKVKELIELLEDQDPEMEVFTIEPEIGYLYPVEIEDINNPKFIYSNPNNKKELFCCALEHQDTFKGIVLG